MDRLTKRNEQDTGYYYPHCFKKCDGLETSSECEECDFMDKVSEKLGRLEDLEEQGKLYRGWIPCSERLPEEHESIFAKLKGTDKWSDAMFEKASSDVNATIEFEDKKRAVKTLHTIDGTWNEGNRGLKFKVIAWQPLPEPYKLEEED